MFSEDSVVAMAICHALQKYMEAGYGAWKDRDMVAYKEFNQKIFNFNVQDNLVPSLVAFIYLKGKTPEEWEGWLSGISDLEGLKLGESTPELKQRTKDLLEKRRREDLKSKKITPEDVMACLKGVTKGNCMQIVGALLAMNRAHKKGESRSEKELP